MEKGKPSKKKAYHKNRKPEPDRANMKYVDWRLVGKKKIHGQSEQSFNEESSSPVPEEKFSKRPLQQPKSRLGDLDEIWQETHVGQDFEVLVNAPISTGSFVFKSEKNWTLDASKYDEFFSVDVKNLSAIINCIPYNQLIGVDSKYFTKDELTYINSTAEQAKKSYNEILESVRKEKLESDAAANRLEASEENDSDSNTTNQAVQSSRSTAEINPDSKVIEEDLDFLLSLKEPVRAQSVAVNVGASTKCSSDEIKVKNIPAATKSIDLEKWLDLVLDD